MKRWILMMAVAIFMFSSCQSDQNNEAETDEAASAMIDSSNSSETPPSADTIEAEIISPEVEEIPEPVEEPEAQLPYSRVGYISSVVILTSLPEVQQAEKQLQNFAQSLQAEIQRQQEQLQAKYTEYMKDQDASKSIIEVRTQELQQMQDRILQLQQNSEQELAQRKEKLYAPILKKVDGAIAAVAKEYGYTHIIDITAGSLVYADSQTDLTALVLNKLGIKAPARQ